MISNAVKIAAIQMRSSSEKVQNIQTCIRLVNQAAADGAQLVCLPECCLYIGGGLFIGSSLESIREPLSGPSMRAFQQLASDAKVCISLHPFY